MGILEMKKAGARKKSWTLKDLNNILNRPKAVIVGYGFVGKATEYFLKTHVENPPEILIHDPALKMKVSDWSGIDYAFICVPTPLKGSVHAVGRKLDIDIVDEACKKAFTRGGVSRIVIRSTIGPDQTSKYTTNMGAIIWPEFLREKHWKEDIDNADLPMVVGGYQIDHFLKTIQCHKKIFVVKPQEAAMMKIGRNAALAIKVELANEFKNICDEWDMDYKVIADFFSKDPNLGKTHWDVPGPDGKVGFGGTCLPKDLTHTSSICYNYDNILKVASTANKRRRSNELNRKT